MALSWPSERDREALCLEDLGRHRVAKGLEENRAGPSGGGGGERGIFKHRGQGQAALGLLKASGLGDLEVTEYIARIRSGPFEREDGASVHLATTEARFMPN